MTNKFGTIGIVIALFAITIAIFQDRIRSEAETVTPIETSLSSKVFDTTLSLFGINDDTKTERVQYDAVSYTYSTLGIFALIMGVISFLQKESHRFAAMAAALGIIAIAWEYVLIAVIIAVIIFLIAGLSPI